MIELYNVLNGPNPASLLFIFTYFHNAKTNIGTNLTINDKSRDGVVETRTRGGRMEGTDESTELWRHPENKTYNNNKIWHFGKKVVAAKSFEKHIF